MMDPTTTSLETINRKKILSPQIRGFFLTPLLLFLLTILALSVAAIENPEGKNDIQTSKETITIRVIEPYNVTKTIARTEMVNVEVMIPVEKEIAYYDFIDVPQQVSETIQGVPVAVLYKNGKYIFRLLGQPKPNTISVTHNSQTLEPFREEDTPYVINWNLGLSPIVTYNRINKVSIPKYEKRIEYIPNIKAVEKTTYQTVNEIAYREVEKPVEIYLQNDAPLIDNLPHEKIVLGYASSSGRISQIPLTPEDAAWTLDTLEVAHNLRESPGPQHIKKIREALHDGIDYAETRFDTLRNELAQGKISPPVYAISVLLTGMKVFSISGHALKEFPLVAEFLATEEFLLGGVIKIADKTLIKSIGKEDADWYKQNISQEWKILSKEYETWYNSLTPDQQAMAVSSKDFADGFSTLVEGFSYGAGHGVIDHAARRSLSKIRNAVDKGFGDEAIAKLQQKNRDYILETIKKDDKLLSDIKLETKLSVKRSLLDKDLKKGVSEATEHLKKALSLDDFSLAQTEIVHKIENALGNRLSGGVVRVRQPHIKNDILEKLKRKEISFKELSATDGDFKIADPVRARVYINSLDPKEIADLKTKISDDLSKKITSHQIKPDQKDKDTGYRAQHFDIQIGPEKINVEIQLMTRRQDQWANWEHAIRYKTKDDHLKQLFTNKNFREQFHRYAKDVSDYLDNLDNGRPAGKLPKKPKGLPDEHAFDENKNYWRAEMELPYNDPLY